MNRIILILMLCLTSTNGNSEDNKYQKTMLKTLSLMDQAAGNEDYLDCANTFERIAEAEKDRWIPYYYSSHCCILMSYSEADGTKKDLILDRAQLMLDKATLIAPEESEIHVLQAFLYPGRILVDPVARGMVYMEKSFQSLGKAMTLNPKNPRSYFLLGINKLNMPSSMGGGAEVARPLFLEAEEKFKSFQSEDPLWPKWGEDVNSSELAKLGL